MKKFLVTGDRHWIPPFDKRDPQWQFNLDLYAARNKVIYQQLVALVEDGTPEDEILVIHGAAKGVDTLCNFHAKSLGYGVRSYPAMWEVFGRRAGPVRNREMLDKNPEIIRVLAFHDDLIGKSKGTLDMCKYARSKGIFVTVYKSNGTSFDFVLPKQTSFI